MFLGMYLGVGGLLTVMMGKAWQQKPEVAAYIVTVRNYRAGYKTSRPTQ